MSSSYGNNNRARSRSSSRRRSTDPELLALQGEIARAQATVNLAQQSYDAKLKHWIKAKSLLDRNPKSETCLKRYNHLHAEMDAANNAVEAAETFLDDLKEQEALLKSGRTGST